MTRWTLCATVLLVACGATRPQVATAPTVRQWFEAYSPITMAPSVERSAVDAAKLVRWLEVETSGAVRTITFRPDGRVKWRLLYGARGLDEKLAYVDGVLSSRSVFERDGHPRPGRVGARRARSTASPACLRAPRDPRPAPRREPAHDLGDVRRGRPHVRQ